MSYCCPRLRARGIKADRKLCLLKWSPLKANHSSLYARIRAYLTNTNFITNRLVCSRKVEVFLGFWIFFRLWKSFKSAVLFYLRSKIINNVKVKSNITYLTTIIIHRSQRHFDKKIQWRSHLWEIVEWVTHGGTEILGGVF